MTTDAPQDLEPDHPEVRAFWELARFHAKFNSAPSYFGPTTLEVVVPPAWSYGGSREESDAFVASVLSGETSSTEADHSEYDDAEAPLPTVGSLSILCDGSGRPAALLEVTRVDLDGARVAEHFRVVYRAED
jgi:uncharacterized protein YhfF